MTTIDRPTRAQLAAVNAVCDRCEQGLSCRFRIRCDPVAVRLARNRAADFAALSADVDGDSNRSDP